jgi:hypothetical protein
MIEYFKRRNQNLFENKPLYGNLENPVSVKTIFQWSVCLDTMVMLRICLSLKAHCDARLCFTFNCCTTEKKDKSMENGELKIVDSL